VLLLCGVFPVWGLKLMAAVVSLSCNMITTHVWLHGSLCVKQFFWKLACFSGGG
jgi:hypothetical protein